ncbi:MAG: 16S rRNA (adenine(1518)-N(6)/adenine(1519)-N(6))-dimethyltransferase RsmA [Bacteroidetes bacterium]|nr:16S rRNA (adenine(1518)-N(6)/adenine(1519)-N(6))-dimethyltransferase RsmA [Bacteroidota bacterium]MCK5765862.1 16S rRNA (adenine(1518)-N(6)/adenine(1519)-N(6))-dimethyltransferase RsmA [Bacteroidales bacterium]
MFVSPKKSLGQHFLIDRNIAEKIVSSLPATPARILEIGPGTGILTKYILENPAFEPMFIETDREAVEYLNSVFPGIGDKLVHDDFLKVDLRDMFHDSYQIVGNLPYNISSQIFFRMLDDRDRLISAVVMIQKEVAERIRSGPGSKVYGILSVLLQTWFDVEYLFTVSENVFKPRPRVKSAVIRLSRNTSTDIGCDPGFYFRVVKAAFNQRRKTLRNALKSIIADKDTSGINQFLGQRAEQLSVEEFIELACYLE